MPLLSAQEKGFTFHGFNYAVQCWGDPSHTPVIALHGWLDNSESFSVLAEHLNNIFLIVPDLAGHGFSDQRLGFAEYALWSESNEICAIAEALDLDTFVLMGHSRGAMMAHIIAAIVPERIQSLILLDAIVPPPVKTEQMLPRLRKKQKEMTQMLNLTRFFTDKDKAIRARCQSDYGGLSRDNAKRLAKRGVSEDNHRFYWHADNKLKLPSGTGLTADQIGSILSQVTAPTLAILAKNGLLQHEEKSPVYILSKKIIQDRGITVKMMNSDHFLHMNESAEDVANEIMAFIEQEILNSL